MGKIIIFQNIKNDNYDVHKIIFIVYFIIGFDV